MTGKDRRKTHPPVGLCKINMEYDCNTPMLTPSFFVHFTPVAQTGRLSVLWYEAQWHDHNTDLKTEDFIYIYLTLQCVFASTPKWEGVLWNDFWKQICITVKYFVWAAFMSFIYSRIRTTPPKQSHGHWNYCPKPALKGHLQTACFTYPVQAKWHFLDASGIAILPCYLSWQFITVQKY